MFSKDYARHYDLYYAAKNYAAEVEFILELAARFGPKPKIILDMGCGTGRHLVEFGRRGLQGNGFDLSPEMLQSAREHLQGLELEVTKGDLRTFRNGLHYDLVLAMFAVIGYLTTNEDLLAGFKTAAAHLRKGGLFIFDGWFGPAVLAQRPQERIHHYNEGDLQVIRKATPRLDPVKQIVTVHYDIIAKNTEHNETFASEDHCMRFLFVQEIKFALQMCGLDLIYTCPFMDMHGELNTESWNICFVAGLNNSCIGVLEDE